MQSVCELLCFLSLPPSNPSIFHLTQRHRERLSRCLLAILDLSYHPTLSRRLILLWTRQSIFPSLSFRAFNGLCEWGSICVSSLGVSWVRVWKGWSESSLFRSLSPFPLSSRLSHPLSRFHLLTALANYSLMKHPDSFIIDQSVIVGDLVLSSFSLSLSVSLITVVCPIEPCLFSLSNEASHHSLIRIL